MMNSNVFAESASSTLIMLLPNWSIGSSWYLLNGKIYYFIVAIIANCQITHDMSLDDQ